MGVAPDALRPAAVPSGGYRGSEAISAADLGIIPLGTSDDVPLSARWHPCQGRAAAHSAESRLWALRTLPRPNCPSRRPSASNATHPRPLRPKFSRCPRELAFSLVMNERARRNAIQFEDLSLPPRENLSTMFPSYDTFEDETGASERDQLDRGLVAQLDGIVNLMRRPD